MTCTCISVRWGFVLQLLLHFQAIEPRVQVTLEPSLGCVCPKEGYGCGADSVVGLTWTVATNPTAVLTYTILDDSPTEISATGLKATFSEQNSDINANITSQLMLTDILANGTNGNCDVFVSRENKDDVNFTVCVVGPASAPTGLSVVCDSSSAVVSFQSPVYGGECVEYYVVTAVGSENITCDPTEDTFVHNCNIPSDRNVNSFNFTVHSVTTGVDGVAYDGGALTDCCLPFPENVRAVEEECGLQQLVNVSWEGSDGLVLGASIRVNGKVTSHQRVSSHLLVLDHIDSGPVEIAVTFSSEVCNKTTVTNYTIERVLTGVSLRDMSLLVIESRNCTATPENYRIVVTSMTDMTLTQLVNVTFNHKIEHDVGGLVEPGSQYPIRVELVESTSGVVIDERNYTIINTTTTETPGVTDVIDTAQPNTDADDQTTTVIAVSVAVGAGLVAAGLAGLSALTYYWLVKRNASSSGGGEELKMLRMKSTSSGDPPYTPAPAVPEEPRAPDVVPPLYADLVQVAMEKEQVPAEHMYHVLEEPSPETEQQTEEKKEEEESPSTD